MRWDLYVSQNVGAGNVALAIFAVCFGIFSWWYLIQRIPWLAPWRQKLTTAFWGLVIVLYLAGFFLAAFILRPEGG
jgi:hypothetical protein